MRQQPGFNSHELPTCQESTRWRKSIVQRETECCCRNGGAYPGRGQPQKKPVRRLCGGCGRLRNLGRGAGDRPSGSSRSGPSRSNLANDSCPGERAVATGRGRVACGRRTCRRANLTHSVPAGRRSCAGTRPTSGSRREHLDSGSLGVSSGLPSG
jgi:hypothetical protein